jgi:hypothetical protein
MNNSLTHYCRSEALLASPKLVFRRSALVLVRGSTTDLTTVACRALMAFLNPCAKPRLLPPTLVLPVARSRARLLMDPLYLLLSLEPPRSKNSLVSVASTRPASLHSKLDRILRRHSMTLRRAPHS